MAELADALDLGSSALKACRFKSCSRHQMTQRASESLRSLAPLGISAADSRSSLRDSLTPAKRLKFKSCSRHQIVLVFIQIFAWHVVLGDFMGADFLLVGVVGSFNP